ncbi:MAG: hypothetical protein LBG58_14030 [Planctomycetaceae bacterium]|jgi:hypothetical protein|nr:hypothetical protein [Planctomycetaceae bacterium]
MPKTKTTKRKHAGRPPLPKNKRRDQQISVRLSIDELKELEVAVHDQIVAEAAREILLEAAKRRIKQQQKSKKSA